MKKILLLSTVLLLVFQSCVFADQYVNGYYRQNGTYVQPYHRTNADNSVYNNYSTKGNTNPYTGQPGYVNPVRVQQNYNYNYNNNNSQPKNNYFGY